MMDDSQIIVSLITDFSRGVWPVLYTIIYSVDIPLLSPPGPVPPLLLVLAHCHYCLLQLNLKQWPLLLRTLL